MKQYITLYLDDLTSKINNNYKFTKKDLTILKDKIIFFEHERLVHLLVTLFYILFTFIFLAFSLLSYLFLIIFFICLIFDLFYIKYYFYLENKMKYIYTLYDKLNEILKV